MIAIASFDLVSCFYLIAPSFCIGSNGQSSTVFPLIVLSLIFASKNAAKFAMSRFL